MSEMNELELDVRGMTCDSCARHVEKALKGVPGVRLAEVPDWKSARARVLTEDQVDPR